MHSDRKHERKSISYPGWIMVEGRPLCPCLIRDVSDGGAMLALKNPEVIPDSFRLLFSPTARSYKGCLVRWRRDGALGVQFASKTDSGLYQQGSVATV